MKAPSPPIAASNLASSLAILPVDLARWDRDGRGDLLAVFFWQDVRPLRGAAGLLDWRLCGKLSGLIQSGRLTGTEGEQLLLPSGGRLPWRLIMVMGLGPRLGFSSTRFRAALTRLFTTAKGLEVHEIALAPPGRDIGVLPARRALDLVLGEARGKATKGWFRRLTVIEAPAVEKELLEWLRTAPSVG